MINLDQNIKTTNMEKTYQFREYLRQTYNKADIIGDLNGKLLNVRMSSKLDGISINLSDYFISITSENEKYINDAIKEIDAVLKIFARQYSYMSDLPDEDTDEFETWLATHQIIDVIRLGNTAQISL